MHGEDEHLRFGPGLSDSAQRFEAVQLWHDDVEKHNVGLELPGLFYGFAPRCRLAADLPSRLGFEQRAQALAHHVVIIRNQDA